MTQVRRIQREVSLVERDARLPRGPEPDIGFSSAAFAWAAGRPLAEVLADGQSDRRRLRPLGAPGARLRRSGRRRRRARSAT